MQTVHYPVLKQEVLTHLVPVTRRGTLVDCTLGEGGHTEALLSTYPEITVVGIDRDEQMLQRAQQRLEPFAGRFFPYNGWFDELLEAYPQELEVPEGILMDLGISMYHFESSSRGFSFRTQGELDMRLDTSQKLHAAQIINTYQEKRLADLIYSNGEERYSRRIARAICEERKQSPILQADRLREIIYQAVPPGYRRGKIHPATKTFQALRIEVNNELDRLHRSIQTAVTLVKPGGRIAVITFHSLEDRIVKHAFRRYAGRDPESGRYKDNPVLQLVTKKPLVPTDEEREENPASRSAKLRVAQRIQEHIGKEGL